MAESKAKAGSGKGKAFFDRADQVAETGNWDFAIELYLEGIQREPDNLERGHKPLREVSLKRKASGGKGPGMMETFKKRAGKNPVQNLCNAEYLLAKEPGSAQYMLQVLQAAKKLELPEVTLWIGEIALELQKRSEKKNVKILQVLTETFHDLEDFGKAIQACELAAKEKPGDNQLQEALRELGAKYTLKKGQYGQEGDFTRAVKDMDKQKELMQRDSMVKSEDYLVQQVKKAQQEYEAEPTVPGKVSALVDALLKFEDPAYENQAIDVLTKAFADTKSYQFKMRIGDIRIRQIKRKYHKAKLDGDREALKEAARELLAFELQEYTERAANYPTDLGLKYELGVRQFMAGKLDDAIASLQQAQRDPRRRVSAMNLLGQAFKKKGWLDEAAETFQRCLENELGEQREKEIRYNLGDVLAQLGRTDQALEEFSDVAQLDYNYKDVRQRVESLREKKQNQ
ncbi:MAG: tetratricopeptide repeat protein [Phycisphaerae bacterium]